MLKQRLITAAILIPLVVWALLDLQSGIVTYCLRLSLYWPPGNG